MKICKEKALDKCGDTSSGINESFSKPYRYTYLFGQIGKMGAFQNCHIICQSFEIIFNLQCYINSIIYYYSESDDFKNTEGDTRENEQL